MVAAAAAARVQSLGGTAPVRGGSAHLRSSGNDGQYPGNQSDRRKPRQLQWRSGEVHGGLDLGN